AHGVGVAGDHGVDRDLVVLSHAFHHLDDSDAGAHGTAAGVDVEGYRRVGPARSLRRHDEDRLGEMLGRLVADVAQEVDAVRIQLGTPGGVLLYELFDARHFLHETPVLWHAHWHSGNLGDWPLLSQGVYNGENAPSPTQGARCTR